MTKQKKPARRLPKRNCDFCDSEYSPVKTWQRFCNPDCHDKHWAIEKGSSSDKFKRIEKRIYFIEKKLGIIE